MLHKKDDLNSMDIADIVAVNSDMYLPSSAATFKKLKVLHETCDDYGAVVNKGFDSKDAMPDVNCNVKYIGNVKQGSLKSEPLDVGDIVPVPPDGGYGWIIVLSAFYCSFVVDGIATAFSPFIDEYTERFNASVATVGLIGSSLIGSYLLVGPLVSGLVNRYGARMVSIFGCLLAGFGFLLAILSTNPITMILTYGVAGGAGLGFIYLPAMVIVCFYFEKKRSIAVGFAVAGSGVGTIIMPPLFAYLIKSIGSSWTLVVLAAFSFTCVFFCYLFKPLSTKSRKCCDDFPKANDDLRRSLGTHQTDVFTTEKGIIELSTADDDEPVVDFLAKPIEGIRRIRAVSDCVDTSYNYFQGRRVNQSRKRLSKSFSYGMTRRKRITVRDYAYSIAQSPLVNNNNNDSPSVVAPNSSKPLESDLNEFAKPMSRSDIFYQGPIKNLPEFVEEGKDYEEYRVTHVSIPTTVTKLGAQRSFEDEIVEKEAVEIVEEGKCRCLPTSVKTIFAEMIDITLLKEPAMILICLSNIFAMLGFYIPFMFLRNMAHVKGVDSNDTEWFLSVLGIFNTIGRVAFGWLADQNVLSPLTLNNLSLIISGLLTLLCPFYVTYHTAMAYSILYGFIISAYICLTTINLTNLLGLERLTNAFGMVIVSRSVACFLGTPLAGFCYDVTKSYDASFWFAGLLILLGGVATCLIPCFENRRNITVDCEDSGSVVGGTRNMASSRTDSSLATTVVNDEQQI